jgi:glutaredoxin
MIVIAIVAVYQVYTHYMDNDEQRALDADGNPIPLVFTYNNCGQPCDDALSLLDEREIEYETVNISDGKEQVKRLQKYDGGLRVPTLIIGSRRLMGYNRSDIISALAEAYGMDVLTSDEKQAMQNHFDDYGDPRVIMYGVDWCGYCRKARNYFDSKGVYYEELDIEESAVAKQYFDTLEGSGTPLIYIGFRRVHGFNPSALDKALELL